MNFKQGGPNDIFAPSVKCMPIAPPPSLSDYIYIFKYYGVGKIKISFFLWVKTKIIQYFGSSYLEKMCGHFKILIEM